MSAPLTLLFLCECLNTCLRFQDCLEREGCHLLLATDRKKAAEALLFPRAVDAVLIHNSTSVEGSVIASALKLISPHTPMLLITGEWPSNGACPPGLDALCHTPTLSRRAARDIVRFARRFVEAKSMNLADGPQEDQGFSSSGRLHI